MKILDNIINWKIYLLILLIISFIISIFVFVSTLEIKNNLSAILEVDEDKNFYLLFETSNIQQISDQKIIYINIEGKRYMLDNVELILQGNNKFIIKFENDDLIDILKTKSLYNVTILYKGQMLIQTIFT